MPARRVVIVGSGVAGALVAQSLLARDPSCSILMLEAGPSIAMRDRRKWLDLVTADTNPYAANLDRTGDIGTISPGMRVEGSRVLGRGGSTTHWNGMSFRFKPEDFAVKSNTGLEIDWPFDYDTLEPWYHRAEIALGVAGDSSEDDPPRKGKPYPVEAPPYMAGDAPVMKAMDALGMSYGHLPMARTKDCVTTGTCYYCPVGGKYSADMTLDTLGSNPRFELRSGAPATRILLHAKGRASGVEYLDMANGETRREDADVVVVCAGSFETPKLLLASQDRYWPEGIGNDTGHVGQHPKMHDGLRTAGFLAVNAEKFRQELDFPTLVSRHYDTPAEQREGKLFFVHRNVATGAKSPEDMMAEGADLSEVDAAANGRIAFHFYGHREIFSEEGDYLKLAPGRTRFGLPKMEARFTYTDASRAVAQKALDRMAQVLERMGASDIRKTIDTPNGAAHYGGTARMSREARDGVIDGTLKIHDMDNVYLCSNAVFPNISAVNPTLTLGALALRLGEHLGA